MLRTLFTLAIIVMAGGLLSACGKLKPLPSDTFYRLPPTDSAGGASNAVKWTDGTLYVERFRASGIYKERAIASLESDGVSIKQSKYHYWHESPELLLQQRMVERLTYGRVASKVVTDSDYGAELMVAGKILRFEKVHSSAGAGIAVTLDLTLQERKIRGSVVYQQQLNAEEHLGDESYSAIVHALSRAVDKLFDEFIANAANPPRAN